MAQRKGGLGRGLDALIQAQAGQAGGSGGVQEVEIDAIEPNPFQPRTDFDPEQLASLAASKESDPAFNDPRVRYALVRAPQKTATGTIDEDVAQTRDILQA